MKISKIEIHFVVSYHYLDERGQSTLIQQLFLLLLLKLDMKYPNGIIADPKQTNPKHKIFS